ncbi:MAG: hypothetical protein IT361_10395 [Gemmatimonadaceae bacterium]|nr:hypothetical protein [Gemmatimonadaceae bacterium]
MKAGPNAGRALADVLALAAAHVSPALASREGLSAAVAAVRDVPADTSPCAYLECRLGADAGRVDTAFFIPEGTDGPARWIERDCSESGARSVIAEHVLYDLASNPAGTAGLRNPSTTVQRSLFAPGVREVCDRVLSALPRGARLVYIGDMSARGKGAGIRLCIAGLPNRSHLAFLDAVAWPGSRGGARLLLEPAAAAPPIAMIHLDVDGRVRPGLGVEYAFARVPQLAGRLAESSWLAQVADRGWCTRAQCHALEAYCGAEVRTLPHHLWPSTLVRRVNHVKFQLRADRRRELKAYLCLEIRPRRAKAKRDSTR